MIRNVLIVILVFAIAGSIAAMALFFARKKRRNAFIALGCLAASVLTVIFVPGSFHQVDTGTIAVVRSLGKITGVRTPGTHFDFYITNTYEFYDTKVQQDKILTSAYSKDGQTMDLEVFLQYQVQTDKVMQIATEYGSLDALQARIETVTIEKTKSVMSSAEAMKIIQNRAQFSDDVSISVRNGISGDYYVNVKDVVLTNIDFTDEFEKAVEDKVIAEQEKQASITRAEAELEVAKLEAQRKIAEAEGNAEAQKILAQATAEAASSKIIELARSLGFPVDVSYVYADKVIVEKSNGFYSTLTSEREVTIKEEETNEVIVTNEIDGEETIVVTTTTSTSLSKTKYTITYDADHTKEDLDNLVIKYLEYLAYLEKWDGELPEVVSGTDAISILIPTQP